MSESESITVIVTAAKRPPRKMSWLLTHTGHFADETHEAQLSQTLSSLAGSFDTTWVRPE
jgi:hypothetical protein